MFFFFIPYNTNAPVYHWPFATVGLIAINVAVYVSMAVSMLSGELSGVEQWMLSYGDGLHPTQWITSNFVHAGIFHLLGNMLFLWAFGIVVEGKIGWWKFLACYIGIGVVECAVEQTMMLGHTDFGAGSLGASAIIFGIVAMAMVWAPANDIIFLFVFVIAVYPIIKTVQISIMVFGIYYFIWQLVMFFFTGFSIGSAALHLMGGALGFALAMVMFKKNLVDCEGYDLITVWKDEPKPLPSDAPAELSDEQQQVLDDRHQDRRDAAHKQIRALLADGKPDGALTLYRKMSQIGDDVELRRDELLSIIKALHTQEKWSESIPFMVELLKRFPEKSAPVRVKLAQICLVHENRPGRALSLLEKIPTGTLSADQEKLRRKLAAHATKMQDQGELELEDDDDW